MKRRRVDQAIIRDVKKIAPNKFMAPYLLPNTGGDGPGSREFVFRREYEMEVRSMDESKESYTFMMSESGDAVTYTKVAYRIELRKSKVRLSEAEKKDRRATTIQLIERAFTAEERSGRESKLTQLDPDVVDEAAESASAASATSSSDAVAAPVSALAPEDKSVETAQDKMED